MEPAPVPSVLHPLLHVFGEAPDDQESLGAPTLGRARRSLPDLALRSQSQLNEPVCPGLPAQIAAGRDDFLEMRSRNGDSVYDTTDAAHLLVKVPYELLSRGLLRVAPSVPREDRDPRREERRPGRWVRVVRSRGLEGGYWLADLRDYMWTGVAGPPGVRAAKGYGLTYFRNWCGATSAAYTTVSVASDAIPDAPEIRVQSASSRSGSGMKEKTSPVTALPT